MKNDLIMAPKGELTLESLHEMIKMNAGKIEAIEKRTAKNDRSIRDIEEEYPLLPPEADDLSKAVQRKGVEVMGGKKSNAYNDVDIRRKVYRDIYGEVKRQYGLVDDFGRQHSYKKLKRKYFAGALAVVESYELPIHLQNEVDEVNDLDDI